MVGFDEKRGAGTTVEVLKTVYYPKRFSDRGLATYRAINAHVKLFLASTRSTHWLQQVLET
jgi:hypothetical protein